MSDTYLSTPRAQRVLDPMTKEFKGESFALFDLYRAAVQAGANGVIEGRTFTDCVIEGPAVMLVQDSTDFEGVNFGPTGGDLRSMLFRSLNGTHAIGSIPVRNCTFVNCQFIALGITGGEDFLNMLVEQVKTVD